MDETYGRIALLESRLINLTNEIQFAIDYKSNNADVFFLLTMAMIIFFMQAGFAFLEAGSVRSKNVTNILIKNVLDSFLAALLYWAVGYAFAFGTPSNPFIGHNYFFAANLPLSKMHHWFFQYTFAATASTIVSGALAERCEFIAYFVYSVVISGWIYPVVSHWVWDPNGWLVNLGGTNGGGFQDFAGSGVVHLCGGTVAIVGCVILGPRLGRFNSKKFDQIELRGHSVPLCVSGGFILAFGFLAFNGGSQGSISKDGDGHNVALAVVNTMLSGSSGALMALLTTKMCQRRWSLLQTVNGSLAGMVAICSGCNVMYPWGSVATGAIGALSYMGLSVLLPVLKIDDPLDAFPVHFGAGLWGLIATPILNFNSGIVFYWNRASFLALAWNLIGAAAIIGWSGFFGGITFGLLRLLKLLRVDRDVEIKGLDEFKHKEPAYPLIAYGQGWPNYHHLSESNLTMAVSGTNGHLHNNSLGINSATSPDLTSLEIHSQKRSHLNGSEPETYVNQRRKRTNEDFRFDTEGNYVQTVRF